MTTLLSKLTCVFLVLGVNPIGCFVPTTTSRWVRASSRAGTATRHVALMASLDGTEKKSKIGRLFNLLKTPFRSRQQAAALPAAEVEVAKVRSASVADTADEMERCVHVR